MSYLDPRFCNRHKVHIPPRSECVECLQEQLASSEPPTMEPDIVETGELLRMLVACTQWIHIDRGAITHRIVVFTGDGRVIGEEDESIGAAMKRAWHRVIRMQNPEAP